MKRLKVRMKSFYFKEAREFLNKMIEEKPVLPFLIPCVLLAWIIERCLVPLSNWVPLIAAVWVSVEYGRYQRRSMYENLNQKWKQLILYTMPSTPLEPCEWLNKLLLEVWPNHLEPKMSKKFQSTVERRLKYRKPKLVERIEVQDFSLGSCPPVLGQHGIRWTTSSNQTLGEKKVMRLDFDWDSNDMSVVFFAKLGKPLLAATRIVINSIHIKGDLLVVPVLDGHALLYSFESTPEVRMGVSFGNAVAQPGLELPGVSTWLVKLLVETIEKSMVEPHRLCYPLPHQDLKKKAVGGVISVAVVSATNLSSNNAQTNGYVNQRSSSAGTGLRTFVEVRVGDLMRKTSVGEGSEPVWNSTFNMTLHAESGAVKFLLYELDPAGVKFNYLTSCEIKVRYVADGSTIFWAIGDGSSPIAHRAEQCGEQVKMVVPFEDTDMGEMAVGLEVKEWQFSDGSVSLQSCLNEQFRPFSNGSANLSQKTGRKLKITVMEGRGLVVSNKSGKCDPYLKIQYGKNLLRTKTLSRTANPVWGQTFEFDELTGGEYLKVKCCSSDLFGDESIGSARINLEGLSGGTLHDYWIPLEKASSGEVRLQIEVIQGDNRASLKDSSGKFGNGYIELVIIEAKDLVAADFRGTSDPFVKVHYGNRKKQTKVVHKTLDPQWNQTLEFPETGEPLILHVKDHNAVLPSHSIGHCTVEYERLPPNQTSEKWIPLQGVRSGEIHVKITRRVPELEKKTGKDTRLPSSSKALALSTQMHEMLKKLRDLTEENDTEALLLALTELESIGDAQEDYMVHLETEKALLLSKIKDLGNEIVRTSSSPPIV